MAYDKTTRKARCTAAEREFRANRFARMIANGATRSDLTQYGAAEWGLKQRQVDEYIQKARDCLQADWNIDRQAYLATLLAQLNVVHKKALEAGQYSNVVGAINTAARLTQLLD